MVGNLIIELSFRRVYCYPSGDLDL